MAIAPPTAIMDLEHSATLQARPPQTAAYTGAASLDSVQMETLALKR